MLELAVLGLLLESPMHGYQLRKELAERLGLRVFSHGSVYPALRRLVRAGLIVEETDRTGARRTRRTYRITADGKERFAELVGDAGPHAWEDEGFGIHVAFFSRTPAETRMRILEGRRRCVEQRREGLRSVLARAGEQIDHYTLELHRLGLETTDREVRWLNELIATEIASQRTRRTRASPAGPTEQDPGDVAGPTAEKERNRP